MLMNSDPNIILAEAERGYGDARFAEVAALLILARRPSVTARRRVRRAMRRAEDAALRLSRARAEVERQDRRPASDLVAILHAEAGR
jgi:hypothetical protein